MSPLDLIPGSAAARFAIAAGVCVGSFAAGWTVQGWRLGSQIKQTALDHQKAVVKAVEDRKVISDARIEAATGEASAAKQDQIKARADAAAAADAAASYRDTAGQLRRLAADTASSLRACNPAPAPGSPAEPTPDVVLANVFGRLGADEEETDRAGQEAAASLDVANREGLACQRIYGALRKAPD